MDDYGYFLLIAEELNISRAAKRAFISQQSLSKYLKHLEDSYGTALFTRKPEFALTPAGRIVLEKAMQIRSLQSEMKRELAELKTDPHGTINFGVTPGRGEVILPLVFPDFHERYPNVNIRVKIGMTSKMTSMVQSGGLDLMVGVNPEITPDLKEMLMYNEPFYLVVSNTILQRYFSSDFPRCKLRFANGVDIREFQDIPFVGNSPDSHFYELTSQYTRQAGVKLNEIFWMDNGLVHLSLVQQGAGACFLPLMQKQRIVEMNRSASAAQQLNAFPLKGHTGSSRISLVLPRQRAMTPYLEYFVSLLAEKVSHITQSGVADADGGWD